MKSLVFQIIIVVAVALGGAGLYLYNQSNTTEPEPVDETPEVVVENFQECQEAGYEIMESYPRQCRTPEGETFVEDIGNENEKMDLIIVSNPRPNDTITSPLVIEGEARGYWFFEASFPVALLDGDGNEIAIGIAQAQSEWMTNDFVPFEATLQFTNPVSGNGTLILHRDNPSGLPENDDELIMPVNFSSSSAEARDGCVITGCSAHICADEEMVTTCEYLSKYACYSSAICEKQQDGQCGWTQTAELTSCISAAN